MHSVIAASRPSRQQSNSKYRRLTLAASLQAVLPVSVCLSLPLLKYLNRVSQYLSLRIFLLSFYVSACLSDLSQSLNIDLCKACKPTLPRLSSLSFFIFILYLHLHHHLSIFSSSLDIFISLCLRRRQKLCRPHDLFPIGQK